MEGNDGLGKPILTRKRSGRKPKTTPIDPVAGGTEPVKISIDSGTEALNVDAASQPKSRNRNVTFKEGGSSRPGKSHVQDTAENAGNKPQEEEEMLRDSLVLVDPFTEEQELHLREAAIELNFNWRKIKKSKKYADIFFEFTSEMLEAKYIQLVEKDNEDSKKSNPGSLRTEDSPEISDGGSSSKTLTDDGSVQLRRSARISTSKKGSGVVTPKGVKGSRVVAAKGVKGSGGNRGKNPIDSNSIPWTTAEEEQLRIAALEYNFSWAAIMKSKKYSKVFKHRNEDLIRLKCIQLLKNDAKLAGVNKNKPYFFVGQSSTMNNSDGSAANPVLNAMLDGNELMRNILNKVTTAVDILQEKKEEEKKKQQE